jgi:hypothetical protein
MSSVGSFKSHNVWCFKAPLHPILI